MTEALRPMSHSRSLTEANATRLAQTGLLPHESTLAYNRRGLLSGARGRVAGVLLGLTTAFAIGGVRIASAQEESSPAPSPAGQSLLPGESPLPTDVITAENPCPPGQIPVKPTPTPSPEPSRTPAIAVKPLEEVSLVNPNGEEVLVTFPPNQAAPSEEPSAPVSSEPPPSPTPDPRTAGIECIPDPNAQSPSPEPTVKPEITPRPELKDLEKLLTKKHPHGDFDTVSDDIVNYYEEDPKIMDIVAMEFSAYTPKQLIDKCGKDMNKGKGPGNCGGVVSLLLYTYLVSRDEKVYDFIDRFIGATEKKQPDNYEKWNLDGLNEFKEFYPYLFN